MSDPQSLDLRLVVKRHGLILDERPVDKPVLSVGRDPECDIVLDDPATSRRAAELRLEEDGLWVVDAGSLDGIRVADEVVERRRMRPGEEVEIGSFTLEIHGDEEAVSAAEATVVMGSGVEEKEGDKTVVLSALRPRVALLLPDGSRRDLEPGTVVLGRGADCDVVLDSSAVSKRHAEIRVEEDGTARVRDLGSTNGTQVNGEAVEESELGDGDTLELADVTVGVEISALSREEGTETRRVGPGEATIVAGADIQAQIQEEAAAMARERVRVEEEPTGRRRWLLVVLGVAAVLVVMVVGISLMVPRREAPPAEAAPGAPAPAHPEELMTQGLDRYEAGEILDAVDLWEQAVELDPGNREVVDRYAQTLYRVGLIYEGEGRYQDATRAWRRLVEHVQDPEHTYLVRARAKLRKYE